MQLTDEQREQGLKLLATLREMLDSALESKNENLKRKALALAREVLGPEN